MEVKLVGISGSPIRNGNTDEYLKHCLKSAEEIDGVSTEMVSLAKKKISDCNHCNFCLTKQAEGKFCGITDDMTPIFPKLLEADGFLFATPVYISRLSGLMANFFDRMRCIVHGAYYKDYVRDRPAGAFTVIWYRNSGAETALISVMGAILTFNMLPMSAGIGGQWGATAVSSLNGTGKFDPKNKLGVLDDAYGMEAGAILAKRIAVTAKALKASKEYFKEFTGKK
jgi:multimeric flavodoxin WrbA